MGQARPKRSAHRQTHVRLPAYLWIGLVLLAVAFALLATLIDKEGVIRFTSRADNGDMMLQPDAIFPVLEGLEGAAASTAEPAA